MKMNSIVLYFLFILILRMINRSRTCLIFPALNCSCFQSDDNTNHSHLYCQADKINETTFEFAPTLNNQSERYFRSVSIEFLLEGPTQLFSHQFDPLGKLFAKRDSNGFIELFLRFTGFPQIQIDSESMTSNMFGGKHSKTYFSLDLIPFQHNRSQVESNGLSGEFLRWNEDPFYLG